MPAKHLLISGRVQGVFFRASAREKAEQLHLHGWVRNTDDGTVEIYAEGTDDALQHFITWCHRGPPDAAVEEVQVSDAEDWQYASFTVTH